MRRARPILVGIALAVALGACNPAGGDAGEGAPEDIAEREGVVSRSLAGTLDLRVTGAVDAHFSGQTPLRVVTLVDSDAPKPTWLLSVGLEEPIDVGGRFVRTAFDLLAYEGNGSYELRTPRAGGLSADELNNAKGSDVDAAAKEAARSGAFLLTALPDAKEVTQFAILEEPCALTVREKGNEGKLDCPKVRSDAGGGTVALTWSWKADPSKVLEDSRPPDASSTTTSAPPSKAPASANGSATAPTTTARAAASEQAQQNATPVEQASPEKVVSGGVPISIDIAPACITHGTVMRLTVRSAPDSSLTIAASYADGDNHETFAFGTTDGDGIYRMAVPVPAKAPPGQARLLASVTTPNDTEAGAGSFPFRVEESC